MPIYSLCTRQIILSFKLIEPGAQPSVVTTSLISATVFTVRASRNLFLDSVNGMMVNCGIK